MIRKRNREIPEIEWWQAQVSFARRRSKVQIREVLQGPCNMWWLVQYPASIYLKNNTTYFIIHKLRYTHFFSSRLMNPIKYQAFTIAQAAIGQIHSTFCIISLGVMMQYAEKDERTTWQSWKRDLLPMQSFSVSATAWRTLRSVHCDSPTCLTTHEVLPYIKQKLDMMHEGFHGLSLTNLQLCHTKTDVLDFSLIIQYAINDHQKRRIGKTNRISRFVPEYLQHTPSKACVTPMPHGLNEKLP